MPKHYEDDVIAAIATPIGEGGISVIRVSGKGAIETADRCFKGKESLATVPSHTVHYGHIVDPKSAEMIDEVMATVFRAPHSYTAEETVEISCHGGVFVTRRVLSCILTAGARYAGPGEFTRRAFLNGRIDLSQAEAIGDLIRARSDVAHKASISQLQGRLSHQVQALREKLITLCGLLELELDFSEEGLEFTDHSALIGQIYDNIEFIHGLIESFNAGKLVREGIKAVLVGKPNTGKSSLLNALLEENRAIVTEIPGTTRDLIEESIIIDGVLFKLVDTAGIRQSEDIVELEGIKRTEGEIKDADIILYLFDHSTGITESDRKAIEGILHQEGGKSDRLILIENKIDLKGAIPADRQLPIDQNSIRLSAKTHEGMTQLRHRLSEFAASAHLATSEKSVTINNLRHKNSLEKAAQSLKLVVVGLEEGKSNEFISVDLRNALEYLGEIIGVVSSEDVLNTIFGKFCIGK